MNTSVYIAKRYLFSRKKMHAINIISGISMFGVFIASTAFVIILSVFNGFEEVILSLYNNFSPEIKIEPRLGKTFDPNTAYFSQLEKDPRVFSFTRVLQEKVLVKYNDKPIIGTIMGVDSGFIKNKQLDSIILSGKFLLKGEKEDYAVIGSTIQGSLGISVNERIAQIEVYSPRRDAGNGSNPLDEFVVRAITPAGVFGVTDDFDDMVITPLSFVRDLLYEPKNVSSLQINYKKGTDVQTVQLAIQNKIGKDFSVKNRFQQNTELYKTLNYEHWFIFMILAFVLIIAIFNIIGSLTMLVIDKQKDIAILTSLGANKQLIQGIFFFEGMMISAIGCVAGIGLGLAFCLLQKHFGLVKMGSKMSALDAFPIAIKGVDFLWVFLTISTISVISSGISSRLSIKNLNDIKQDL